jgi:arylsulfatase A-like enzyme
MTKLLPLSVAACALAFGVQQASAALCFDPFADATAEGGTSYSVGDFLFGQVNAFDARWYSLTNTPAPPATGFPVVAAGNLSHPGLPASTGNCIAIPSAVGVMGRLTLGFAVTNGTAFFSFLLKVTDLSGVDSSGPQNNFFAGFGDTIGNQNATLLRAATRVLTKRAGAGFNLGVARNSNDTSQWIFDPTPRNTNEVLFIVGSYDYGNHTANLWINPPASTFGNAAPPAPTLTATAGADLNANGIRAFVLGCRTNPPPGCLVDELRIGTTWCFVTGGPDFRSQPVDQSVNAGQTAVFTVVAGGGPPLSHQWRRDGLNLSDNEHLSGAHTATLTISGAGVADAGGYSVVVTNSYAAVTSSVASLTVSDPTILSQPDAQVLPAGTNALFQVVAEGTAPLTYQWFKDGVALADKGRIAGATAATLTISGVADADVGSYQVRVRNGTSSTIFSERANLFITDPAITPRRPNIIFILCDDLGYGDLGVLYQNSRVAGQPREATPNLDSLAASGLQLRQHYCPAPVCAPSRASLLLGVHQGHANVRNQQWDKALADNHTLATVLQKAGYATAAIGKWGLGGDDVGGTTPAEWVAYPTKRGFDYFLGYERHADGHDHYPKEAIYSSKSKECYDGTNNITPGLDKCYTTDLFTARAKKWIEDQRAARPGQPFFLYLAYDTPHAVYELPTQAYPAGGGTNGGLQWLGTPGHMINTASGTIDSFVHPDYAGATYDDDNNPLTPEVPWPEAFKRYATSVRRIDEAIGDLRKLLQDLGIATNTLVVFTSDNGPTTEDYLSLTPRYQANFFDTFGPFDGVKRDTWEGGIRVPTFVYWPGTAAAGGVSHAPSEFQDWLPTFTELAGLPPPARSDGVSLVPMVTGSGTQPPSTIYVEYSDPNPMPTYPEFEPARRGRARNEMQVIRLNGFQGVRYDMVSHADDFEIYDVANDPKQTNNLALDPAFASLQQQMKDRVLQLRRPDASAPRPYDNEPLPAVSPAPLTYGVEWRAYTQAFPWVPELTALTSTSSGTTNAPTLAVRPRDNDIGLLFRGYVLAPADGDYTVYLSADTGALLRLHDAIVIDADFGYAGGSETSSTIRLKAGLHPFRLYYARRNAGAPALTLSWSGPGIPKQPIPTSAFRRDGFGAATPPSAQGDTASTPRGTPVSINALANDSDDGTPFPLGIVSVSQPGGGSAVTNGARIVYTPYSNFLGDDWFTYTISDGQSTSTATVRVEVFFADGSYWFPFNQTNGFTTAETGGGATATLVGFNNDPAQWVAGKFNHALQFDGVANEVVINGFKGITGTNPRTVSAWIKTAETNRSLGIVSWGDLPSGNKWSLLVQNTTDPKGALRLELGFGNTIASTPVNDGQWHHVACVLDAWPSPSSTNIQFYVDGQLDAIAGGAVVPINTTASNDVLIGSDIQGRFFNGVIDEVRLYNRALNAAEILAESNSTRDSALAWHRRHLGNAALNWSADKDGDGVTELGEYAFGGQPWISDARCARIVGEIVSNRLQIRFRRRVPGTHELTYQVQRSLDLKSWTALAGTETSTTPDPFLADVEEVIFRAASAVSNESPMFVRVAVILP